MRHWKRKAYITGTTVVIIRTPAEIVMAADSAVQETGEDGTSDVGVTCKIAQIGENVFFAAAGWVGDTSGAFLAPLVAIQCCSTNHRFLDAVKAFENAAKSPLSDAFEDIRQRKIGPVLDGMTALETVFAGFENGVLKYSVSHFSVKLDNAGFISITAERATNCPSAHAPNENLSAIGKNTHIRSYLASHRREINLPTADKAELVRRLIQLEIDNDPNGYVREPIVILRLTQKGPEWVRNEGVCRDFITKSRRNSKPQKKRPKPRRR